MNQELDFNYYYEQMKRELKLQALRPHTVANYLRSLRRVHESIPRPLNDLSIEDLKVYFSELVDTYSWSTVKLDRCALSFFYKFVLKRKWNWIEIIKIPRIKTLPDILSQDKTLLVLKQLEKQRYRVCLTAIYAHLSKPVLQDSDEMINQLMARLGQLL